MSGDHVDEITAQWNRERPELDVSAMAVLGRIARLEKLLRPRLAAVFARHDLESWEFDVLATLRRHAPGELTPGQLLASTMITSGAMTHRIDRLEQRGLVERARSPEDGRLVLVGLTADGRDLIDRAVTDHVDNQRELVAALTPQQLAELTGLLRMLSRSLESDPAASPPDR